jgi:hypothetical protein
MDNKTTIFFKFVSGSELEVSILNYSAAAARAKIIACLDNNRAFIAETSNGELIVNMHNVVTAKVEQEDVVEL